MLTYSKSALRVVVLGIYAIFTASFTVPCMYCNVCCLLIILLVIGQIIGLLSHACHDSVVQSSNDLADNYKNKYNHRAVVEVICCSSDISTTVSGQAGDEDE